MKKKKKKIIKIKMKGMKKNSICTTNEKLNLYQFICHIKFDSLSLIYKASFDGFRAEDFHRCCDGKERVVVLVQANNFIFGIFYFYFLFF